MPLFIYLFPPKELVDEALKIVEITENCKGLSTNHSCSKLPLALALMPRLLACAKTLVYASVLLQS